MGLSTKQVSSDDHGWNQALLQASTLELAKPTSMKKQSSQQQQQQQQGEPLKCPRCDSTNTKFCYYNNYNKSQPRHFCKACKRHWTKGGTLRNVPVGGGRKNKRKTSNAAGKSASKTAPVITTTTTLFSEISNTHMTIQAQQPMLTLPIQTLKGINDKNFSEAFYQTLGRQPSCSMPDSDLTLYNKSFSENNGGIFLGSTLNLLQNDQDLQFPYSNLGSFESNPNPNPNPGSISSIQSPNLYNYTGEDNALEETVMNSTNMAMSSSSMSDHQPPWQISNITNGVMDMAGNWGWDDFDKFVSVDADLGVPWDESEVKP